tara:strand:- start:6222 stop:6920 length:699 start_codon:yes stop_codon:yes gene_type:complete
MKIDSNELKRREKLFSVLDKIKASKGTLIIGGDFFDFWFDFNQAVPDCYKDVFKKLEGLKKEGIEIHYIAGNHDYWDFGCFESRFAKFFHKRDLIIDDFNCKILVTHGDGLLKDDYSYRFMKKIIRSKIFITFFKLLSNKIGYKIGGKISNTSKDYHHFDDRSIEIKKEMKEFAIKKWKEQFDVILMGHYHQKEIVEGNSSKKLIFLGDWLKHFNVTKFDGQNWSQFSWNEL